MIILGAGRIGTGLKARADAYGVPCEVVSRTENHELLDGPQGDPILVAVRNDDLVHVVPSVPVHRHQDLVFVQNGMFKEVLEALHVQGATRGLLYFASRAKGGPIEPGVTSWFSGPHAEGVARWFQTIELQARSVNWATFLVRELEKFAWICANGPLCERFDCTVGEVADQHRDALTALTADIARIGRMTSGVDVELEWLVDRMVAYSHTIPTYRASVKEWRWRNGWVEARAAKLGVELPAHTPLMNELGHP